MDIQTLTRNALENVERRLELVNSKEDWHHYTDADRADADREAALVRHAAAALTGRAANLGPDDDAPVGCPACGCARLEIEATVCATVDFYADGEHQLEDTGGSVEWTNASACTCTGCGHSARLGAFRRKDDAEAERAELEVLRARLADADAQSKRASAELADALRRLNLERLADKLAADLSPWPGTRADLLRWLGWEVDRCKGQGLDGQTAAAMIDRAYLERVDELIQSGADEVAE